MAYTYTTSQTSLATKDAPSLERNGTLSLTELTPTPDTKNEKTHYMTISITYDTKPETY
jgi:hypothetical protein